MYSRGPLDCQRKSWSVATVSMSLWPENAEDEDTPLHDGSLDFQHELEEEMEKLVDARIKKTAHIIDENSSTHSAHERVQLL